MRRTGGGRDAIPRSRCRGHASHSRCSRRGILGIPFVQRRILHPDAAVVHAVAGHNDVLVGIGIDARLAAPGGSGGSGSRGGAAPTAAADHRIVNVLLAAGHRSTDRRGGHTTLQIGDARLGLRHQLVLVLLLLLMLLLLLLLLLRWLGLLVGLLAVAEDRVPQIGRVGEHTQRTQGHPLVEAVPQVIDGPMHGVGVIPASGRDLPDQRRVVVVVEATAYRPILDQSAFHLAAY